MPFACYCIVHQDQLKILDNINILQIYMNMFKFGRTATK